MNCAFLAAFKKIFPPRSLKKTLFLRHIHRITCLSIHNIYMETSSEMAKFSSSLSYKYCGSYGEYGVAVIFSIELLQYRQLIVATRVYASVASIKFILKQLFLNISAILGEDNVQKIFLKALSSLNLHRPHLKILNY